MKIERIGNPGELAEYFAKALSNNKLSASTNEEATVLLANFASTLPNEAVGSLAQMLDKNETVLFLENVKKEHFPDNALVSVDAKYCIVKSSAGGRIQHVLLCTPPEQGPVYVPTDLKDIEAEVDEKGVISNIQEKDIVPANNGLNHDETPITPSTIDGWIDIIARKSMECAENDMQMINASLMRGSITRQEETIPSDAYGNGNKTIGAIYFSYDVELAAVIEPTKSKRLKFTSVNSFVRIEKMGKDADWCKGDGTILGSLRIYPGDKMTFELNEVPIPKGWRIVNIAPESPNSENSYIRTTGWSVGATGGGAISSDPKVAANLSFNYNTSQQYSETFRDFTAMNGSSSTYCFWEYRFTKLYKDWESLFHGIQSRPEQFPELARSTMYMRNEVVYEIPADDNHCQQFWVFICQFRAALWSRFPNIGYKSWGDAQRWTGFNINLGAVKFV